MPPDELTPKRLRSEGSGRRNADPGIRINPLDLIRNARAHWKAMAVFAVLGGGIAGITALLLPPVYVSTAAFQAESGQVPALGGGLAGLASQLGVLQLPTTANPQLMAELLTTDAVIGPVAEASYPWEGGTMSLPTIYRLEKKPAALRSYLAREKFRKAVHANVNVRTGVVRISVGARTPELARSLADTLLTSLNEANIRLRQSRGSAERAFASQRAELARNELVAAENALARFSERNRVITSSPTLQLEESRLRRAVEMAQDVYVQLRLQEEQAAAQAIMATPAINVVDPPSTPIKRSSPRRTAAIVGGVAVGLAVAFLKINVRTLLHQSGPAEST